MGAKLAQTVIPKKGRKIRTMYSIYRKLRNLNENITYPPSRLSDTNFTIVLRLCACGAPVKKIEILAYIFLMVYAHN